MKLFQRRQNKFQKYANTTEQVNTYITLWTGAENKSGVQLKKNILKINKIAEEQCTWMKIIIHKQQNMYKYIFDDNHKI